MEVLIILPDRLMVGLIPLEDSILVRVQVRQLSCERRPRRLVCNVSGVFQNHCRAFRTGTRPVNRTAHHTKSIPKDCIPAESGIQNQKAPKWVLFDCWEAKSLRLVLLRILNIILVVYTREYKNEKQSEQKTSLSSTSLFERFY